MENPTDLPGKQTLDSTTLAGGSKQQNARATQTRRNVAITLWIIGLIALVVASVIVYFHPAPWPFDLQTTLTLQQMQLPPWVNSSLAWVSIIGDVPHSALQFGIWFVGLMLIGVVAWRRGKSPVPWFVTAIFVSFIIAACNGIDGIVALIVGRPRPTPILVHVYMAVPVNSFPSGHVENVVVYYGFLLYLSLSKPISQWRYRWILIPFQLYAVLNILLIGFSRVYEGSHWLTDVSGGYLSGALFLVLLIFLYRWTLDKLNTWYAKRLLEKSTRNQQA
jgi:membrane-associated phospholipid phosphatase